MFNLNKEFEGFLKNIEPDDIYVAQASEAQNSIRDYLKNSDLFKDLFKDSFLSGSYKRSTAIKEIKDVDIIVVLNIKPTIFKPETDIKDIFNKLKNTLKQEYKLEQIEQQKRSIKITWEFENKKDNEARNDRLTLDIVPAICSNNDNYENLWIPDKDLEDWIRTNPVGHIEKISEKNKKSPYISSRHTFVPFVKMLKFWKGEFYKIPKKPKGFTLECIAYNSNETNAEDWFSYLKEGFEDILNKYEMYENISGDEQVDFIKDIGLEGKYISTSTTYDNFKIFIKKVKETLELMEEAQSSENKYDCIKKMQQIFNEEYFPNPTESDKNIKNDTKREVKTISIITGSNKNPEAKSYG